MQRHTVDPGAGRLTQTDRGAILIVPTGAVDVDDAAVIDVGIGAPDEDSLLQEAAPSRVADGVPAQVEVHAFARNGHGRERFVPRAFEIAVQPVLAVIDVQHIPALNIHLTRFRPRQRG